MKRDAGDKLPKNELRKIKGGTADVLKVRYKIRTYKGLQASVIVISQRAQSKDALNLLPLLSRYKGPGAASILT